MAPPAMGGMDPIQKKMAASERSLRRKEKAKQNNAIKQEAKKKAQKDVAKELALAKKIADGGSTVGMSYDAATHKLQDSDSKEKSKSDEKEPPHFNVDAKTKEMIE